MRAAFGGVLSTQYPALGTRDAPESPGTAVVQYDGVNNETLCFAAAAPYTLGSGLNRPEGCSSNWQSAGLQNRMLWVRVPPPLPTQEECS
jgi:hypothetical protein